MKRLLIVLLFFTVTCNIEKSQDDIKKEIAEHKKQISEIKSKIKKLETQLTFDSTIYSIGVTIKDIQPASFNHTFTASGSVEAVKAAYVSPEMNGQIKKIHIKEGSNVTKGQLVVSLNSDVIQKSINEIETGLELAKTLYKKQKYLWDKKIGSELQYLEAKNRKESLESKLKTTKAQLAFSQVRAPFSGIIDEIFSKEGEMASPGMRLMQLVNLSEIYINANVSESYITSIKKNDSVAIKFPSYPELEIKTKIFRIGNVVNPANRTFTVQIKTKNKDNLLKPNVIAILSMEDYTTNTALLVPSFILKNDIEGAYLYIAVEKNGKSIAVKKHVKTGMSDSKNTVITSGLSIGDKVIIKGFNLMKDGLEITFEQ